MTAIQRRRAIAASMLVGLSVLAAAIPSAAEIYKWVDEAGTIHFTDAPPGRAGSAVEVLPESSPRPRPTEPARDAAPQADDARPPDEAASSDAQDLDDNWSDEPELEVEDIGTEIIIESGPDPAVRRRANSPRNRPGQPIRQPGQRPARGR